MNLSLSVWLIIRKSFYLIESWVFLILKWWSHFRSFLESLLAFDSLWSNINEYVKNRIHKVRSFGWIFSITKNDIFLDFHTIFCVHCYWSTPEPSLSLQNIVLLLGLDLALLFSKDQCWLLRNILCKIHVSREKWFQILLYCSAL